MVGALVLLALLYGLCSGRGRPAPRPPALPPPRPGPDENYPPITDMLDKEPMGGAPQWPQVLPPGLPPFPGPKWEHDDPPPPDVVARARALVSTLWARGSGTFRIERTGSRWIAYRAEIVRSGKKGVVVYRVKSTARPAGPAAHNPEIQPVVTPAPGMATLKYGDGLKPKPPLQAVVVVQEELGVKPADGRFGPKTRDAVRAYQRARGLTPDGIVGPKTWAALLQTRT